MTDSSLIFDSWPSFAAEVHVESDGCYTMVAQDVANFLTCALTLEIREKETEGRGQEGLKPREIICHFPKIDDDQLKVLVWHDVILYGIIMVMFQMRILERLLLLCSHYRAENVVIVAEGEGAKDMEVYRDFLDHQGQEIVSMQEQTRLFIPADQETVHDWTDFMEMMTLRLGQILRRERKTSAAIQQYLRVRGLAEG